MCLLKAVQKQVITKSAIFKVPYYSLSIEFIVHMKSGDNNEVPVSLDKTDQQESSSHESSLIRWGGFLKEEERQCRICLQNGLERTLIKACRCRGSVGFVHSDCMRQWILKKSNKDNQSLSCELCHEKLNFIKSISKKLNWSYFFEKFKQQTLKISLIMSIYMIILTGNIYFACLIRQASNQPADGELRNKLLFGPQMQMILTTIVVFVFIVLLIIGLSFCATYFMKKETVVQIVPFREHQPNQTTAPSIAIRRKPFTLKIFPIQ